MSMTVQEPNRAGRAGSRGEAEERMDLVERTAAGAHRALRHPAPAYLHETQIVSPPRVAAGERGGSAVRCCAARSRPRRGVDRHVVRSKASAPAGVWAFLGGVAGFVLAAVVNGIADPDPVSAYKKRHAGAEPSVEVGDDDGRASTLCRLAEDVAASQAWKHGHIDPDPSLWVVAVGRGALGPRPGAAPAAPRRGRGGRNARDRAARDPQGDRVGRRRPRPRGGQPREIRRLARELGRLTDDAGGSTTASVESVRRQLAVVIPVRQRASSRATGSEWCSSTRPARTASINWSSASS
jgi:hypothetical protein